MNNFLKDFNPPPKPYTGAIIQNKLEQEWDKLPTGCRVQDGYGKTYTVLGMHERRVFGNQMYIVSSVEYNYPFSVNGYNIWGVK